jgi:hypothetical protein
LISYITDPAAHASWVVPGTDLYLTGWANIAVQVWRHGPSPVRVINPLVRSEFHLPTNPMNAAGIRHRMGLPPGRLALVMSGSWAVGDLVATVDDLLAVGAPSPVVVCGRNERLRRRLTGRHGVTALGWVSDMAGLMRTCDVAVLNSGGLSLAEATAVGLPVLHYRPLVGQGVANAKLCDDLGIAEWPRTRAELPAAIARAATAVERFEEAPVDPVAEIITVARAGSGWPVEPATVAPWSQRSYFRRWRESRAFPGSCQGRQGGATRTTSRSPLTTGRTPTAPRPSWTFCGAAVCGPPSSCWGTNYAATPKSVAAFWATITRSRCTAGTTDHCRSGRRS